MDETLASEISIFGLSVAGVSAGLTLAAGGRRVALFEIADDLALREQYSIFDQVFSVEPLTGTAYDASAFEALERSGVRVDAELRFVRLGPDEKPVLKARAPSKIIDKTVPGITVIAPNGRPGRIPVDDILCR